MLKHNNSSCKEMVMEWCRQYPHHQATSLLQFRQCFLITVWPVEKLSWV